MIFLFLHHTRSVDRPALGFASPPARMHINIVHIPEKRSIFELFYSAGTHTGAAGKPLSASLKNELGKRLCRMVLAQMPIVLLDHLDARPTQQGNGQQVEAIDDQVRDR